MFNLAVQADQAMAQSPPTRLIIAVVAAEGSPHQPHGADVIAAARDVEIALKPGTGLTLQLIERREDCSADTAEAVARELVALPPDERPQAVVGHLCSPAAIAAARIYADAGIIMISPGARHPRLTELRRAPLIFRLASRDDRLPYEIAQLVAAHFQDRRIALVHEQAVQARAIVGETEVQLRILGIKPALRLPYVHGERAYHAVVDRLISAEAEVLVIPTQPVEARVLLSNLAERGRPATVIVGDIVAAVAGEAIASKHLQVIAMLPWLEHPPPSRVQTAVTARPERSPTWLRSQAAVEVLMHAARRAQGVAVEALVRVLETESAPTVVGPIRFDTRGDPLIPAYTPWVLRDGRWRPRAQ